MTTQSTENFDELLQALTAHLEALRANGVQGFDCAPETLQKLEKLAVALKANRPVSVAPQAVPPAAQVLAAESTPVAAPNFVLVEPARPVLTETLEDIRRDLGDCKRCGLCSGRHNIVFGAGNPKAKLVFVGEGPGHDEDMQGIPFVGAAGQLLTKIIEAMKLTREDVYICNVVKCRPPGNRNPAPEEIAACMPFLERQIAAIDPMFICGLGGVAVQTLLNTDRGITKLRGQWTTWNGIRFMPTFHPSYLLRNAEKKREVWADVQEIMKEYPY